MPHHYRAMFISDVHLGTRSAQAVRLLDFLVKSDADTIYLVGDIVDFWRIRRGLVWPNSHNDVLHELLRKAREGTRIVFIPGNHDDDLRAYCGTRFGPIEIALNAVHVTADGRRYLVMHGDEYDVVVNHARWLALLGERSYAVALAINRPFNWARRLMGLEYWSLSAYLKNKVKGAVGRAGNFENALVEAAASHNAAGVICGHIHHAASKQIADVHYMNTGDWVESCTAIIETEAGELKIVQWPDNKKARAGTGAGDNELEAAA